MKKIYKDIFGWIVYLAFLVVLVYGLPKGLSLALKTNYPLASVTSTSMWPALKRGDLVLIKGISAKEEINIGDIVVYQNNRGFTIHRVIALNEQTIITKGDANNIADAPVAYQDVIGKTLTYKGRIIKIPSLGAISILLHGYQI